MISGDFLDNKAKTSKIDRYTILREYLQLLFLRYFYEEKTKGLKVYFKGGTAIRFLFNSFRFSEDLDFTGVGEGKIINRILKNLLPKVERESGFKIAIKDEKVFEKRSLGYRLVFVGEGLRQPLGIRLDFSFRERPLDPETSYLSVMDYPVSPLPLIEHLSRKEITAEKIRAIFSRSQPRDLFDLWFLFKGGARVEWGMVKSKMKYYPEIVYSKNILIEKIAKYKTEEMKRDLNQFIPEGYRRYEKFIPEVIEHLNSQTLNPKS